MEEGFIAHQSPALLLRPGLWTALLLTCVLTACGSGGRNSNVTDATPPENPPPQLVSVTLSAPRTTLTEEESVLLSTHAFHDDGSTTDVSDQSLWSTSNESVLTVTADGIANALAPGSSVVIASYQGLSSNAILFDVDALPPPQVTVLSVSLTPDSVQVGETATLTATADLDDGSTVDATNQAEWFSSDENIATITFAPGPLAQGVTEGTTTITAEYVGVSSNNAPLTVLPTTLSSLTLTPSETQMEPGEFATVTVQAQYSDDSTDDVTDQVEWNNSAPEVLEITSGSPAVMTALEPGTSLVSATLDGVSSDATSFVVLQEVAANTITQGYPYLEWSLTNPTWSDNPFDVPGSVTFTHDDSGETHTTAMFYDGDNSWKFRFTGTRVGEWTFVTASSDTDLDGRSGTVTVTANPGEPGFVGKQGHRWVRTGTGEAFVPQLVMYAGPHWYHNAPAVVDAAIQTFLVEHGFNGFHVPVFCRWFDINDDLCTNTDTPEPDFRTFEALELLITKVYEAGGVVHLWQWGDVSHRQTPNRWGFNGTEDKRLQRYIAARLGPLPGWSMGYGFDCWEYATDAMLTEWHEYLEGQLGWPHLLGARGTTNALEQISESLGYSGYEQHRPDYAEYVATLERRPSKPSMSEDRFRIRIPSSHPFKDYTEERTRRGLWDSTMAGGVANIWGNLVNATGANTGATPSAPYINIHWIKTHSVFFEHRFFADMVRDNSLTDGVCLKRPGNQLYVFYKADASSLQMNLDDMVGPRDAVAVDCLSPYEEIPLGTLDPAQQTWDAPYESDWAIAVGE